MLHRSTSSVCPGRVCTLDACFRPISLGKRWPLMKGMRHLSLGKVHRNLTVPTQQKGPALMNVDDRMGECALPVLLMFANRRREWCGPVLMVLNDHTRECTRPRPVGTRGGCGAGWGPCACPWSLFDSSGFREARWSHSDEDKHKAPSSTPPRPLSLQDAGRTFPDALVK